MLSESAARQWRTWNRQGGSALKESHLENSLEFLTERFAELELALEDVGWTRLAGQLEQDFSPAGREAIYTIARYMWLKNPLIKRAVTIKTDYTWGQGLEVSLNDEGLNTRLQAFLDEPGNRRAVFGELARRQHDQELQVFGNKFFCAQGRPGQIPAIRAIPTWQIKEIISNPEDASEPWLYRREWHGGGKVHSALYPDWLVSRNSPLPGLAAEDVRRIDWDKPVYHVKVNCLADMKFGVSDIYAAIDWARAYKEFLEDRATVYRALAKFAWKATVKGKKGVTAVRDALASTLGAGLGTETNPSPPAGSVAIETEGLQFQPVSASSGTSAEEGRRFLLMVAAATDLPETFFGDANVGNHATAKTLDRPTELMIKGRQELWSNVYADLVAWMFKIHGNPLPATVRVDLDWPPVLHHDLRDSMEAIERAARIPNVLDTETTQRLVLTLLGVDDIDEVIANMVFDDGALAGRAREDAQANLHELVQSVREALEESR